MFYGRAAPESKIQVVLSLKVCCLALVPELNCRSRGDQIKAMELQQWGWYLAQTHSTWFYWLLSQQITPLCCNICSLSSYIRDCWTIIIVLYWLIIIIVLLSLHHSFVGHYVTPASERVRFILGAINEKDETEKEQCGKHELFTELEEFVTYDDGQEEWKETARWLVSIDIYFRLKPILHDTLME